MKDFVIDNILTVVREDDDHNATSRLFVESCGASVKDLEGYLVFVENDDKLNMALEKISKYEEKYRDTFEKMISYTNNGVSALLNYMLLGESDSWTEALMERYGTVDKLLDHYNLAPIKAELNEDEPEDIIEDEFEEPVEELSNLNPNDFVENIEIGDDVGTLEEEAEDIIEEVKEESESEPIVEEKVEEPIEEEIPIIEEEPKETKEEIQPKEEVEKHSSNADVSYNNVKDREEMKREIVGEVVAQLGTNFQSMNNNIGKLVDIMSKLAETQGVPKEELEEIEEDFDDTPITRDELTQGIDYIKYRVGNVDERILNRFISMYDHGNEELVTDLLTDVMEFISKEDK